MTIKLRDYADFPVLSEEDFRELAKEEGSVLSQLKLKEIIGMDGDEDEWEGQGINVMYLGVHTPHIYRPESGGSMVILPYDDATTPTTYALLDSVYPRPGRWGYELALGNDPDMYEMKTSKWKFKPEILLPYSHANPMTH